MRQFGESLLSQFDHGDLRRQVQRSETHERSQRAENWRVDACGTIKLIAAMHHSVTDDGECRQLQRRQQIHRRFKRGWMRAEETPGLLALAVCRLPNPETAVLLRDAFDSPACQLDLVAMIAAKDSKLQGR